MVGRSMAERGFRQLRRIQRREPRSPRLAGGMYICGGQQALPD